MEFIVGTAHGGTPVSCGAVAITGGFIPAHVESSEDGTVIAAFGIGPYTHARRVVTADDDPVIGPIDSGPPANDTAPGSLNGRLIRLTQNLSAMSAKLPPVIGAQAMSASMSVTIATDDARIGPTNATAPASDTAAASLNGRLIRIAQNISGLSLGGGGTTQYAEDVAAVSGNLGIPPLSVRTDTPISSAGANGRYAFLGTDADGRLWSNPGGYGATSLGKRENDGAVTLDVGTPPLFVRRTSQGVVSNSDGDYAFGYTDDTGQIRVSNGSTSNPTSTLTLPTGTATYAAGQLVGSSATAGSCVVSSFTAPRAAGIGFSVPMLKLTTAHISGWSAIPGRVRLWSAAPTYTNGDNAAYVVATGGANCLAIFYGTFEQHGDAAVGFFAAVDGPARALKLASGQTVYWDLQILGAAARAANKTIICTPEIVSE